MQYVNEIRNTGNIYLPGAYTSVWEHSKYVNSVTYEVHTYITTAVAALDSSQQLYSSGEKCGQQCNSSTPDLVSNKLG